MSLRAALDALFATFAPPLPAGGAACRAISDLYDAEIRARFDEAKAGIAAPLALVATGGWARRELAPYSDIDFIVLHERDEASAKQLADKLLYPLWDEKLAIGHAIREARATARLAREDLATATALLDARHIAGDRRLTTDLMRATLGALAPGGNPNDFIAMLAAETEAKLAQIARQQQEAEAEAELNRQRRAAEQARIQAEAARETRDKAAADAQAQREQEARDRAQRIVSQSAASGTTSASSDKPASASGTASTSISTITGPRAKKQAEVEVVLARMVEASDPEAVSLKWVQEHFGLKQTTAYDRLVTAQRLYAEAQNQKSA